MKKFILIMAVMLSTGTATSIWGASQPKHRYHAASTTAVTATAPTTQTPAASATAPTTQAPADKSAPVPDEGVEAYSDTSDVSTSSAVAPDVDSQGNDDSGYSVYSTKHYSDPFDYFGNIFGKTGIIFFVILILVAVLLFLLAPLIIIILILRYLVRRHNDRVKIMEKAMENGQEIPEAERSVVSCSDEFLQKRGLRNAFLGAGMMVMFLIWDASFLAGIGALVMFYGLGQCCIGGWSNIKAFFGEWNDYRSWRNGQRKDDNIQSNISNKE